MGKINIVNDSDGRLTVELDGKPISPQEIFNSSDSNTNITDDANFWDLQTLGEQYDLTLEDIMAAVENYADTKNADIDYSVDELPSSVEPEAGAMSTFYENNKGTTTMNITKGRLKQIIQEELSRANEGYGIQGHEPEEELVTVTAIDLVDAVSELIKRSLDSGADAGSLMGEVKKVFGENIPNPINDLFPIDMGE